MDRADVFARTAANRRRFANAVERLDPSSYDSPTLCTGWSVHVLAAHMIQPFVVGFWGFVRASLRQRGKTDATVDAIARRTARKHRVAEVVDILRQHADVRLDPPCVGPMGSFADQCLHLRDLARPLGLADDVPLIDWRTCLDYLSGSAAAALVPHGRLAGIRLNATDQDWSAGSGADLTGPSEALAMAATGRTAALADLRGAGVDLLGARLSAR